MVVDIKHEDNNMIYLVSTEKKEKKKKISYFACRIRGIVTILLCGEFLSSNLKRTHTVACQ